MSDKDKLEAQLQGIASALDALEAEYDKGMIDIGRYMRLKTENETRKAELEQELDSLPRAQRTHAVTPPEHPPATHQPPGERALLGRAHGSPFVVGRPLRASEPIFGREAAFRFVADQLVKFSSANLVGERRMGKTSLLDHLAGRQEAHLTPQPDQPPLALACLDLQRGVSNKARFYGAALRELLDRLPPSRSAEARGLRERREQLHARPEASYDEFERGLERLRDARGVCVYPVLVVDEFERLLEAGAQAGFPYPDFFNGLRALITADLFAMIVASRRSLANYFRDPARPGSLTSTFPSYFTPFTLGPLDDAAADALLLQPERGLVEWTDERLGHTLTLREAVQARGWADGHPCHLQAAGQAWYEARVEGHSSRWARERFEELKDQSCMTGEAAAPRAPKRPARLARLRRALRALLWDAPQRVGRLAQGLGRQLDDVAAWIIGAVVIVLIFLALLGVVSGGELWEMIRKGLGL